MFFYNPNYLLFMAPAFFLMIITQVYVTNTYRKWSKIQSSTRITGKDAVERLIRYSGMDSLKIRGVKGNLTDNYNPQTKTLSLSRPVYEGHSIASLAIAAHELGHASQDQEGYLPLKFRSIIVPMVNIGSYLGWILIFLGLMLKLADLAWLGVAVFSGGLIFALTTLPVELDASSRARNMLIETGLITGIEEQRGVRKVLNAASLTYVAAIVTAALQLFYWVSVVSGAGGKRR